MRKTNLLILLCILATISTYFLDQEFIITNLAFSWINILSGRFWTPITALFVHANVVHLLGNSVFLYVFGNALEEEVGSVKSSLAFFLGGFLAFFLSIPFYGGDTPMLGSSAAVFTIAAAVMLIKPLKFSLLFLMPLGLVAILYFLYNIFALQYGFQGNVGYVSHIIGFGMGLPLGMAWSNRWKRNLLITIGLLALYFILQFYLVPKILTYLGFS
ncbi:rhomboid family intramembrane serine protease [Candidatus Bathyarchaeota archaeon]|nr:rhomboid family intramembrane serine protease [Candidatus Bathyarchaeota archaeon]